MVYSILRYFVSAFAASAILVGVFASVFNLTGYWLIIPAILAVAFAMWFADEYNTVWLRYFPVDGKGVHRLLHKGWKIQIEPPTPTSEYQKVFIRGYKFINGDYCSVMESCAPGEVEEALQRFLSRVDKTQAKATAKINPAFNNTVKQIADGIANKQGE